jgi:hypothetical protein
MSLTVVLFLILVVWCAFGIVVSVWMRRRGHELFMWAYLGAVLGPLVVPLALEAIARERRVTTTGVRHSPSGPLGVAPPEIVGEQPKGAPSPLAVGLLADEVGFRDDAEQPAPVVDHWEPTYLVAQEAVDHLGK